MNLTQAQKTVLKANLLANTNQITVGSDAPIAINASPGVVGGDPTYQQAIADWYNGITSPDYFVHRSDVKRVEIYKSTVPSGDSSSGVATTWSWAGYKAQAVSEQNSWTEMFMTVVAGQTGTCDFGSVNNRQGCQDIFGNSGLSGANRVHIFNVGKRRCSNLEKLFVVAVTNPPANTGNVSGDARGAKTNPDVLGYEGQLTALDIANALATG